ncbi:hypothetical protein N180_11665 [Pedobacter antarcticus 4BY]|uniref:Fimbrillin family protein n=2 Tax=Pedobacter antarcticus TaxID=34086 RepID=A0A081PM50_9SPHI|nr:fimbrillin family protein [Pedobacter antarcticus]KEQ31773.1 hypothetical protein N180_11665 [Pedobacter antarcticus 4BY]SFF34523.1 Fimbrillin-like [Pedobacter antarcticus]
MKNQNILLATAMTLFIMSSSCKKDDTTTPPELTPGAKAISFSSSINNLVKTTALNDAWAANDEIGVFMKTGTGLTDILAANKAYKTNGDGDFHPSATNQTIYFPEDGKTVDFIAYYPLKSTLNGNVYPVDISNQNNQAAIDLLYSNNANGLSKTNSNANLVFSHQLSKIEFNVKTGEGVTDLSGLAVTIAGLNTKANFDLATGSLSDASETADLSAKIESINSVVTAEAILLPSSEAAATQITFTLPGGKFKLSLPANTKFEQGKKYIYDIELRNGPSRTPVALSLRATINNWTEVPSGSHEVNQDKDETNPPTGVEEVLFTETFGTGAAANKPKVGSYTGWSNSSFIFSDSYGTTDLRTISAYPDNIHAWLPATKDASLKIEGIKTSGYTKLKLKYDLAPNANSASSVSDFNVISVKVNGVQITVPSRPVSNADNNKFSTIELTDISALENNTVEFFGSASANTLGMRLDNVVIIGVK